MSNFKAIEKLGLDLLYAYQCDRKVTVIYAEDLESLLKSAQVVYGSPDTPSDQLAWSNTQLDCDTHKARLICIEKLVKEPVRVERSFNTEDLEAVLVPKELKGKPFKVVFEEVIE